MSTTVSKVEHSTEERTLRDTVREFCMEEILPVVREYEAAGRVPPEMFRKFGEMGLLGMLYPEQYGGSAMSYTMMAAAIEEIARICPGVALTVAATNSLALGQIFLYGTEEQKMRYMPGICSGEKVASWGLTEPNAGSDSFAIQTRAVRGEGGWVVNGRKSLITHASFCDVAVVMVATEPHAGRDGVSSFIFERGMKGFEAGKEEEKLGMCASNTGDLVFRDCFVPDANLLGKLNAGGREALGVLDGGRIGIASLSVGLAQGALDASITYAKQREQFGKPIAKFQAIQFKIADMATNTEVARCMVRQAAEVKTQTGRAGLIASMAKLFASEMCVKVAEESIQIHGGYGYTKDFLVEKFWRDSKLLTIGEGTSEVQRQIIAKNVLGIS